MLEHIVKNTLKYIGEKSRIERKKIGQFFTSKETARYMARMFIMDPMSRTFNKKPYKIIEILSMIQA